MIPNSFDYQRASSLKDVLKALAAGDGSVVIAGGHSLLPLMKLRMAHVSKVIDIAHLEELKGIEEHRRGARIGAGTTYRELAESGVLRERFPIIGEATRQVADLQVRNRGTIGGNLSHADPASDMPAVMLALGAEFKLRSRSRRRTVPAGEFFLGPFYTAKEPEELLIEIVLPGLPRGAGSAYESFKQQASGYAMAGAAAVVKLSRRRIRHCVVALTGVADTVFLADTEALVDTKGEAEAIAAVAQEALANVEIIGDLHAPEPYRRQLAGVAIGRAVTAAMARAG
jgi:carbon-monoxide dehydrogenase medium subunit